MRQQLVPHLLRVPGEHLHTLGRQAGLEQNLSEHQHGEGALLRQFYDHGIAGGQGARNLVREQLRRIVERDDPDHDADGVPQRVGDHALQAWDVVHREILATDPLRFLAKIGEEPCRHADLEPALVDRLAVFTGEQLAQLFRPDVQSPGSLFSGFHIAHVPAALPLRALPRSATSIAACTSCGPAWGTVSMIVSGGRVPDREGATAGGVDPLSINNHLQGRYLSSVYVARGRKSTLGGVPGCPEEAQVNGATGCSLRVETSICWCSESCQYFCDQILM